jgi:dihydrofolate reductase
MEGTMAGKVFIHATISLDGFSADPGGGLDWASGFSGLSAEAIAQITGSIGAILAGRHGYDQAMARGGMKAYGGAWSGPQFVLTHRPADPPDDPSITFLSGAISEAVATARAAASGKDVVVFGANIAQQCLAEGLADDILLHVVPILLGEGIPLFATHAAPQITLQPLSVGQSGQIANLRFRVAK